MKTLQTTLLLLFAVFAVQPAHAGVAPMPLISLNAPAYASDNNAQAGQANNANYDDNWRSGRTPSTSAPNWLAYDLSAKHPTTVDLVWYNDGTYGYNWDLQGGGGYSVPTDYTIDVNAAAGGTVPTTGWTTLVTVSTSHYHSREHAFNMSGYNWVRINVTGASTEPQNTDVSINMDVYDTSAGIQDTWLFTGDSITAGGMKHTGITFSEGVNASDPHFPLEENAGVGGWTAANVLANINTWLAIFPGHFVTINLGTNDVNSSPGDNTAINACIANLTSIANDVIAAGKVPIIPHIPWANLAAIQSNGPVLNSKIDALIAGNPQIIAGPDLYTFFQNNPGLISSDNLHPSDPAGWAAYRNQWSSWALTKIYGGTVTIPSAPTGLIATAGNTQVALTWNASSGATSYNVKRSTVSGSGYAAVSSPSVTNYTNTGLTNGTTYYFVVTATNSAGTSGNSSQASATPNLVIPPVPTGLTATPGNAQVSLSWNTSAGATTYNVKRSTVNGSGYATIASPSSASYTNTGLTNGTTYYYVVTAVDTAGESAASSQVSATPTSSSDTAQYNFESGVQGWTATGGITSGVTVSGTQKFLGAQSLAVNFNGTAAGTATVSVASPGAPDGATVTYHIWIPSGSTINDIKPYVAGGTWTGGYIGIGAVTLNAWNTYTVTIPTGMAPDSSLGFQIDTTGAWTGTCYIDSVGWPVSGAPPAPTGVTATPGSGQVSLSWNASTGATSYNVKRSTVSGSGYVTALSPATTNCNDIDLINGTTYYYVVTAVNASGESANSSQVSATPTNGIPAAPAGLTATGGNAQVALSWSASTGATSYNVLRSTVNGSGYASVATGVATTSYTNTGLTNGTTYYFVVSATNASGTSANSAQASATPTSGIPPAPTGLTATPGNTQVALSWSASSGATAYDVKRSTVSGSGYVTVSSPTTTSYTNTGLTNGTVYYFVVDAKNASGTSGNSSQVSATPTSGIPPAPTGLTATAGNSQVALSWTASSGATAYDVKRSTVNGSGYATVTSPTTTSYTNTGLTNGTVYYFVVDAKNASGTSGNSSQVSATPAASGDTAQYNFESGVQGWTSTGGITSGVAVSTAKAYLGSQSLAVTFNGTAAGTANVSVPSPGVPDGKLVTWHIWIPAGSTITDVKPYIAGGTWSGNYYGVITTGAWWTLTETTAAGTAPDTSLGIQIDTNGAWSGTVYIDSVSW